MAELILTEEEKAAALWSDLDDAALGKLVKKKIALLTSAAEQLDRVTTFAAAMLLCCAASEQNASEIALEIVVNNDFVERTVETIASVARTGPQGTIGDGKIFVVPLDDAVQISDGSYGPGAVN